MEKNTPLRRILIILLFIIIMPALFFSAYQLSTLGEYEEMIADVYEQQLETILSSANQYAWDFVNTWISRIQNSLTFGNKNITRSLNSKIIGNKYCHCLYLNIGYSSSFT